MTDIRERYPEYIWHSMPDEVRQRAHAPKEELNEEKLQKQKQQKRVNQETPKTTIPPPRDIEEAQPQDSVEVNKCNTPPPSYEEKREEEVNNHNNNNHQEEGNHEENQEEKEYPTEEEYPREENTQNEKPLAKDPEEEVNNNNNQQQQQEEKAESEGVRVVDVEKRSSVTAARAGKTKHTIRFRGPKWNNVLKKNRSGLEAAFKKDVMEVTGVDVKRIENVEFNFTDLLVATFVLRHNNDAEKMAEIHTTLQSYVFPHTTALYKKK